MPFVTLRLNTFCFEDSVRPDGGIFTGNKKFETFFTGDPDTVVDVWPAVCTGEITTLDLGTTVWLVDTVPSKQEKKNILN